eukprot:scaffold165927_cov49-Prasinocladus_malaysianus.AAC.1
MAMKVLQLPLMQEVIKEIVEALRAKCCIEGALIEMRPYLRGYTMNIIYEIIIGKRLDMLNLSKTPELLELDKAFADMFSELDPGLEDF